MRLVATIIVSLLLGTPSWAEAPTAAAGDQAAWIALAAAGTVALMRHAEAPGTFDPPGFKLGSCSTQRLLSDNGRRQATAIGAMLHARNIRFDRVLTSQWCRCVETATLVAAGPVEESPALNSLRWEAADESAQLAEVRRLIRGGERLLLVTHAFNIAALTAISPASGEILVVATARDGELEVRGRIAPP